MPVPGRGRRCGGSCAVPCCCVGDADAAGSTGRVRRVGRICAGGAGAVRAGWAGAGRSEIEISRSEEKEVREVGDVGGEGRWVL